jgi:putative PIN family toxin of toxin-antitoxin system
MWLQGMFELVTSPMLIDELEQVLAYPKIRQRIPDSDAVALVQLISEGSLSLDDPAEGPSAISSRDSNDNFLINLAFESSSVLVSGDPDLLELSDSIPVMSPAEFFAVLERT